MYQFAALVWDESAADVRYARRIVERFQWRGKGWQRALVAGELAVFHRGARPPATQAYLVPAQGGIVLGKLFRRGAEDRATPVDIDDAEGAEIVRTGGRSLIDAYWGRYVAVVHDRARRTCFVLRDPSNRLPCYMVRQNGVTAFLSDVDELADLMELNVSINWRRVAAQLLFSRIQVSETCLAGVTELHAGECVELGGTEAPRRSFYWSPVRLCSEAPLEDAGEAAAALRAAVQRCTNAWASAYPSIVHQLSGGLDSAIVLSCLKDAPTRPKLVCLNLSTPSAEGDERRYARAAATLAGVELIERTLDPERVRLERAMDVARFPSPMIYAYSIENDAVEAAIAREQGADASFSALGGDNLFYQAIKTDYQPADFLRQHGLGRGLLRVAWDTARLTQRSIWSIMGSALRYELSARRLDRYERLCRESALLNGEVLRDIDSNDLAHPWVRAAADLPIGKQHHVFALVNCEGFFVPYELASAVDVVCPLLSQPLIELCLRIPSYVLTKGGRDRALARRAFADALPPEILWRRTKGGMSAYYATVVVNNLPWLREVLLDGALANAKLVDRPALEKCLHEAELVRSREYSRVLDLLCVEAWLRSWSVARHRIAA